MSQYNDFLQTSYWKDARTQTILKHSPYCMKCGSGIMLNIHHALYTGDIAKDLPFLFVICHSCHSALHKQFGTKQDLRKETFEFLGLNNEVTRLLTNTSNTKKQNKQNRFKNYKSKQ